LEQVSLVVQALPSLQASVLLLCVQAPLVQASVVQTLLSSQLTQLAPPVPHCVVLVDVMHAFPVTQPVQQLPPRQVPLEAPMLQAVPFESVVCWQDCEVTPTQASLVQEFPSSQLMQLAPPTPQLATVPPGRQEPFEMQPVQQLPFKQVPLGQPVPLATFAWVQAPPLQASVVQGSESSQLAQAAPP
jgi:hypothetical protein